MPAGELIVVFVHGYSVTSFDTYGELPVRLAAEARSRGRDLFTHDVFLARYISLNDEVRIEDLSAAFETALRTEVYSKYPGRRFACITHSTGAPLVRNWVRLYYPNGAACPMNHLIMLAPANHGSALAQLGKSRLAKLRSWFNGLEPGKKILDWLELGSRGSWAMNKSHVLNAGKLADNKVFYFVLTGQDIDRKAYDHINSYTGEPGSDGVVRVASASLNSAWVLLEQETPAPGSKDSLFIIRDSKIADPIPLRVLTRKSHSNPDMGIMRSVRADLSDTGSAETMDAIFRCLSVETKSQFQELTTEFTRETARVQESSRLEVVEKFDGHRFYFHDRHAMVIFRLRDSEGHVVNDYDLVLTAGPENDPDGLPPGFFTDRQCNCKDKSTLAYYFNFDAMNGVPAITGPGGEIVRPPKPGRRSLGLVVIARPDKGLVRYLPSVLPASEELFEKIIRPNATTLVEIILKRLVSTEVMQLAAMDEARGEWKSGAGEDRFI